MLNTAVRVTKRCRAMVNKLISNRKGLNTTSGAQYALPLCHWSRRLFDLRTRSSTDVPVLLLNQPHPNIPFGRNKQSKKTCGEKEGGKLTTNNYNYFS